MVLSLPYNERECFVIGLVKDAGHSHRRLDTDRGSQSTDSIATHKGVSSAAWYLGKCAN